jgi:hypothetical protein
MFPAGQLVASAFIYHRQASTRSRQSGHELPLPPSRGLIETWMQKAVLRQQLSCLVQRIEHQYIYDG